MRDLDVWTRENWCVVDDDDDEEEMTGVRE